MYYYVYIIKSLSYPTKVYVGKTTNLKKRLSDHNCGTTSHTKGYAPWELITFVGFNDEKKAIDFEKYLKSGSGRAFREKRF